MQKDFHFYCIAVLARAAGFNKINSLILAYCSQYVDDSTEGDPLKIKLKDSGVEFTFDPVRSSYDYLKPDQGLESLNWSAQKRVHIPFHFLPAMPFDHNNPEAPYPFRTDPHSPFAETLIQHAGQTVNSMHRLCRLGVALHTYADTWAHKDFTGREFDHENNVTDLQLRDPVTKKWRRLWFENFITDLPVLDIPEIGHAEALYLPDVVYHEWKCRIGPDRRPGGDHNVTSFLAAARYIYDHLRHFQEMESNSDIDPIPWEGGEVEWIAWQDLEPLILERFSDIPELKPSFYKGIKDLLQKMNPDERCKKWEENFCTWFEPLPGNFKLGFHYDRESFRKDALEGDTDWDNLSRRDWQAQVPFITRQTSLESFWNRPWVQFHRAALEQRHLVLEHLP